MKVAKRVGLTIVALMIFTSSCRNPESTPTPTSSSPTTSPTSMTSVTPTPTTTITPIPTTSTNVTTSATPTLPAAGIAFENLVRGGGTNNFTSYKGKEAEIYVISSNQSLPAEVLDRLVSRDEKGKIENSLDRDKILEVDYSKYFVVLAFNGFRGGIGSNFNIQTIIQENDTFSIIAHFDEGGILQLVSSQYQAVKIDRTQIAQPRIITFKLLDETGQERATVTAEITR